MLFLADESCDFGVVRILRASGHDVVAVSEVSPRLSDEDVALWARREERILLTEDKDFGQLAFASGAPSGGVILIRFPAGTRAGLPSAALEVVDHFGDQLSEARLARCSHTPPWSARCPRPARTDWLTQAAFLARREA